MKIKILILCFSAGLILSSCTPNENGGSSTSRESVSIINTIPTTEIPTTEPATQLSDYIVNVNTGKFHYPDCPSVDQMIESNKLYYSGNKEDLLEYGYSSCGRCKP